MSRTRIGQWLWLAQLVEQSLSISRVLQFESSHRQNLCWTFVTINWIERTKRKEKEAGLAHFYEKKKWALICFCFCHVRSNIFFKWANPGLFFVYFLSFQTNNTIFTTNQCEKMSSPSSIRYRDSNPQPLEHEFPPITTRPGLPPCLP